jgi:hypothetical protein
VPSLVQAQYALTTDISLNIPQYLHLLLTLYYTMSKLLQLYEDVNVRVDYFMDL